jgi:hypothetical protein
MAIPQKPDRTDMTDSLEIIAQLHAGGASAAIDRKIADLVCGKQGLMPSAQWLKLAGSRPSASLDGALLVYKHVPNFIPTDPIEACINALEQWC